MKENTFQSKPSHEKIYLRRLVIHIKNLIKDFIEYNDFNRTLSHEDFVILLTKLLAYYNLQIVLQPDGRIEIKIKDDLSIIINYKVQVENN